LLEDWPAWRSLVKRLARDSSLHRRRAALVLLVGPVRHCRDARLRELALETIDTLKAQREIMITKAISWLLRSLITQHRDAVARYLEANAADLPKIAVRETRTKLATGRKTSRRAGG
jgi:3-methyladenine DNA glycosylase AlkD